MGKITKRKTMNVILKETERLPATATSTLDILYGPRIRRRDRDQHRSTQSMDGIKVDGSTRATEYVLNNIWATSRTRNTSHSAVFPGTPSPQDL